MGCGCKLTFRLCKSMKVPYILVDVSHGILVRSGKAHPSCVSFIAHKLRTIKPKVLNVAGGRESKSPGIYEKVFKILDAVKEEMEDE